MHFACPTDVAQDFKCAPECAQGFYAVKGKSWEDGFGRSVPLGSARHDAGGQCKACHENCSACNSWDECNLPSSTPFLCLRIETQGWKLRGFSRFFRISPCG